MRGTIGVDSTVGRGSVFTITLPLPIDATQPLPKPASIDITGARILIVDDNAVNRAILTEQVKSWGFDCAAAENGHVALAFLERAKAIGANRRLRHPRLPDARPQRLGCRTRDA